MMNPAAEPFSGKIFHSATFEGMADAYGTPKADYINYYWELAKQGVKNIITGCTYVSQDGKMVQPGQAGIDTDDKIPIYKKVTAAVHQYDARIYLQISHAGRQTSTSVTGAPVSGASEHRSRYFMSKPKALSSEDIDGVIKAYATAALRAKQSGFDGVQIHAAHGYLVHQFLHPGINNRSDEYGINRDSGIGDLFLRKIISAIRTKCGEDFPILLKLSAADDLRHPFTPGNFIALINILHKERVSAIEISYGTMDNALNIFRGESIPIDVILKHNFRYKKDSPALRKLWKLIALPLMKKRVIKYSRNYNLHYSEIAKSHTDIPIISVGGFRSGHQILNALESGKADFVSLCRPFIREPDLMARLSEDSSYVSKCENCNICAIMCDSTRPTRCYKR